MAQYTYRVMDKAGKTKKGTVEATSEDRARETLKNQGFVVQSIKEQGAGGADKKKGKKVKDQDLAVFCKQFGSVLNAGVTVISALEMMSDTMENKTLQRCLKEAQAYVQKGGTLADSFKLNPEAFPPILVNMVAAGELSGSLEVAFERLTEHFENSNKIKSKVKGAMTYPIVILIVVIAVVCVLLVGVIPTFADMFEDMGSELPAATQFLVNFSDLLVHKGWLVALVVIAVIFAIRAYAKTETGQQLFGTWAIRVPKFGELTVKSAAANFSRTLATLMGAGVPLIDALEQVAKMQSNKVIREDFMNIKTQVMKGVPLSKPIADIDYMPPMLASMTRIGEETGNIEDMMNKVADYYEMEVNAAVDALTAIMEPLIIVVMGVTVGGIVICIYSPMLSMYDAIDNY